MSIVPESSRDLDTVPTAPTGYRSPGDVLAMGQDNVMFLITQTSWGTSFGEEEEPLRKVLPWGAV